MVPNLNISIFDFRERDGHMLLQPNNYGSQGN